MSFELSDTPTLEAVANENEKLLEQDLKAKVDAALESIEKHEQVAEALEAQQAAAEQLAQLRAAERTLNEQVAAARKNAGQMAEAAIEAMVNKAAGGLKLEARKINEVSNLENQIRFTARAIERLSEHLIPLGHIAALRAEAHALMAQVRALEAMAQERAEKLLRQIRDAVSEEMVLPVDLSKGVSGALLARANFIKQRALQISKSADGLEQDYLKRRGNAA